MGGPLFPSELMKQHQEGLRQPGLTLLILM
jgi:hypothetical protein